MPTECLSASGSTRDATSFGTSQSGRAALTHGGSYAHLPFGRPRDCRLWHAVPETRSPKDLLGRSIQVLREPRCACRTSYPSVAPVIPATTALPLPRQPAPRSILGFRSRILSFPKRSSYSLIHRCELVQAVRIVVGTALCIHALPHLSYPLTCSQPAPLRAETSSVAGPPVLSCNLLPCPVSSSLMTFPRAEAVLVCS